LRRPEIDAQKSSRALHRRVALFSARAGQPIRIHST
jgi:hypothetical protein